MFGVYDASRSSFRLCRHSRMYCPSALRSSWLVRVMIFMNNFLSDPVNFAISNFCTRRFQLSWHMRLSKWQLVTVSKCTLIQ